MTDAPATRPGRPDAPRAVRGRVALIDWTHTIEDFLDNLGLSLDQFCNETTGGWMFGYIHALSTAGVETTLYCFSRNHRTPAELRHGPTGARIRILPVPDSYRAVRRRILNPYSASVAEAAGNVSGLERAWCRVLLTAGPYLATPIRQLARFLRTDDCQAILCQEYENPRFDLAVLLGRRLGIPVFGTFQGGDARASWLERLIRPLSLRLCAGVVVAPRAERDRLLRTDAVPKGRISAINNPIDRSMFPLADRAAARSELQLKHDALVVAWHGRLNWHRKGLDILVDAWARICAARPNGPEVLILMGTGGDAATMRDALAKLPQERVRWVDRYVNDRREISRFLQAADVYAFPSRHEGMPVAPLEAMTCGLPVVACRAPGIDDILGDDDQAGGVLVAADDAIALGGALRLLLDDPVRRRTLAAAARRRIDTAFASEVVGSQLAALLFNTASSDSTSATLQKGP